MLSTGGKRGGEVTVVLGSRSRGDGFDFPASNDRGEAVHKHTPRLPGGTVRYEKNGRLYWQSTTHF